MTQTTPGAGEMVPLANSAAKTAPTTRVRHAPHLAAVFSLFLVAAVLAITSLLGDSITWDETPHLTSGYCCLKTGDFRLEPEHPPLAKMWTALPLLWIDNRWPSPPTPGWQEGDAWSIGRTWLFELNDGERLIIAARCMMVILLLATCLSVYATARKLFGAGAGLLALTLSAFSPTLLAHGRLATLDLPAALVALLTLLAFAGLCAKVSWLRLGLATATLAAFSLTKFSWPLVVPSLLLMGVVAALRRAPIPVTLIRRARGGADRPESSSYWLASRAARLFGLWLAGGAAALAVWPAIWACFGFQYSAFRGPDRDIAMTVTLPTPPGRPEPATMTQAWQTVLCEEDGRPTPGLAVAFIRWARAHRLLPEAYLYGLGYTLKNTQSWPAYLMGELSMTGWRSYFPIAFAVKTPIPVTVLLLSGLVAMAVRRASAGRNVTLLLGLAGFVGVYAYSVITSHFNNGHRHLLPLYPVLFVFAGASAAWLNTRAGRFLVGVMIAWLVLANLRIYPHYLCYFNEIVGGPRNGSAYLADSNIDWGQDLKRLAAYARRHPGETIKLAYSGSALPTRYGFDCEMLPSYLPFDAKPAALVAGTYVISINQQLGIYETFARQAFWADPDNRRRYASLYRLLSRPMADAPDFVSPQRHRAAELFDALQRGRLLARLHGRVPDERIGWSLCVYRLSGTDVDALLRPD